MGHDLCADRPSKPPAAAGESAAGHCPAGKTAAPRGPADSRVRPGRAGYSGMRFSNGRQGRAFPGRGGYILGGTQTMKVVMWGTRGSLATPGRDTARYGGNTSCVEVIGEAGARLVRDAGTGIRALGMALPPRLRRVDVLLTHLHMDHIQGLGFFDPLFNPAMEVHIWGPASATLSLRGRLMRYLSAPLFPV